MPGDSQCPDIRKGVEIMTDYSFTNEIGIPIAILYHVLDAKFPRVKAARVDDPGLLFGSEYDERHAVSHAKWAALEARKFIYHAWFLRAAEMKTWLFDFAFENGLVTAQELESVGVLVFSPEDEGPEPAVH